MWQRRIYDCSSLTPAVQWKRSSFSSKNPLHTISQLFLCSCVVIALTVVFICSSRDRKMALLQMSTVEEAIQALIDLHNYDMGRGHRLRVSFSKSTIWGFPGAMSPFLSPPGASSRSHFYQSFLNTTSKTSMRMALKGTLALYLLLLLFVWPAVTLF